MKQPTIYKSWEDYKVIDVTEDDVKKYGSELDAALIITGIGYKSEATKRKYRVVLQNGLYYNCQNGYWMNAGIRDYDDTTVGMKEYHFWYKEETNDGDYNSKEQENNDDDNETVNNTTTIKEDTTMTKLEIYNMLSGDKYDTLIEKVKEMYKEAFEWGQGIKMQLFVNNNDGELFVTANPSSIQIQNCTCIHSRDTYAFEEALSEETYNIILDKRPELKDLDWGEISKKVTWEEKQEVKEEAIENLNRFLFDYYYEVSNILYELRQEAEFEEKMMLEAKKYEDM